MLDRLRERGLLVRGGRQRTAATHVLAAVRELNRLELVTETLRAALEALAVAAPGWLQGFVPDQWYARYGQRARDWRVPKGEGGRGGRGGTLWPWVRLGGCRGSFLTSGMPATGSAPATGGCPRRRRPGKRWPSPSAPTGWPFGGAV